MRLAHPNVAFFANLSRSVMSTESDQEQQAVAEFQHSRDEWGQAVRSCRMAPPDAGFSRRLASMARAAARHARACELADQAGFEWPPVTRPSPRPYELQPGTGRRGPADLWLDFDRAVDDLERVIESTSMLAVARAYAEFARAADKLARAVADEDHASGLVDQLQQAG